VVFGKRGRDIAGERDCVHAGYAAIGGVTNHTSRLCDEAKANQIVASRRVFGMVEPWVRQLARRAEPEGVQSSGAGRGNFEVAEGG
jgi:class 3 adenylate cyclase